MKVLENMMASLHSKQKGPRQLLVGTETWKLLAGTLPATSPAKLLDARLPFALPVHVLDAIPPNGAWIEYSDGSWERLR
jgi:hypothetical protein